MRLTKGTDDGILGILYLATRPFEQVTLLREVAENQEVPESYLAKIFQDLARGGGYVLNSVHNIQGDVSPENIIAMFDEAYAFGVYPLPN